MKSLCAFISVTKGSSKMIKEKKEVLEWVSAHIKRIYSVSLQPNNAVTLTQDVYVEGHARVLFRHSCVCALIDIWTHVCYLML